MKEGITKAPRGRDDHQRYRAGWTSRPREPIEVESGYADPVTLAGPMHNALDQDYARRSRSAQPQQLVLGPMTLPSRSQGQPAIAARAQAPTESNHEVTMIENLQRHIRDSLMGIPGDLPELKGVRAKLPEAYKGEDDFDRLDNWLQGLIRFFKLHRLTGHEKDADRVLVTGTSLQGRAERWFSHEVERPTRIIRDWTFESVIVGLFRAFITTATAQQAMQRYMQIRFSCDEGVTAFYRELLMWAGRLAQYPDPYSFKRRLLNGLPPEYRHHLALYNGISAEHSSIDDIVREARHLEKTLVSLKSGRGTEKQPAQGTATPIGNGPQKPVGPPFKQRPRNPPPRQHQVRSGPVTGTQHQRPAERPAAGDHSRNAAPGQSASKKGSSKLTCYRCSKTGHISSDPGCPQYRKPEQRQIFAAQVVDDRSDGDQPDTAQHLEAQDETSGPDVEITCDEGPNEQIAQDECPDGSQYDDEEPRYDEYDGYAQPSDEEPEYIRAMNDNAEGEATPIIVDEGSASTIHIEHAEGSTSSTSIQFDDVDWKPRREVLRHSYQRAPWVHGDDWEFTPRDGITHVRGCEKCTQFKEHLIIAGAVAETCRNTTNSSAWDIHDKYEQDLISLGWDLAHEGGRLPTPVTNAIGAAEKRAHRLDLQLRILKQLNDRASTQYNETLQELEDSRLDLSLCGWEAEFWQHQYEYLQGRYRVLEERVLERQPSILSLLGNELEDVQMRAMASDGPNRGNRPGTSLNANVGEPSEIRQQENGPDGSLSEHTGDVARIAAAREDKNKMREREFRAAQRRSYVNGERPPMRGRDRHCMAALVKVNGLEAYALLDSGSTTVSITHDFARVAKLKVIPLDNPVPLQLGTVGSRSMINFGTRTSLEIGPVIENDAYLDVVNIDRYDMIIGTPFMRKHGLVLDFCKDILSIQGTPTPTLASGQEDLMLAKKRALRARAPVTKDGHTARVSN